MSKADAQEWWPVAFLFGFLALLFIFVFTVGKGGKEPGEPGHGNTPAAGGPGTDADASGADSFWARVEERQPEYGTEPYECPVDGTMLDVPSKVSDNRFGGVATDLMKIAVGPREGGHGRPDLTKQDWAMLPCTCPGCGATFMGIDLTNINGGLPLGARESLGSWDLAQVSPALASTPYEQWATDEKLLVRYFTLKQAGFPDTELGFAALTAAYATNFNIWYGEEYGAPSPAYYALAAARLSKGLEEGLQDRLQERAFTALPLCDLYRLLGRDAEMHQWLIEMESLSDHLGDNVAMLEFERDLAEIGNHHLQRVEIKAMDPPVGWYLDNMLPGINGHIDEHRGSWNSYDAPETIEAAILELIQSKH